MYNVCKMGKKNMLYSIYNISTRLGYFLYIKESIINLGPWDCSVIRKVLLIKILNTSIVYPCYNNTVIIALLLII